MPAILFSAIAYKVSLQNYARLVGEWVGIKDDPILVACNACDTVYNLIEPKEAPAEAVESHKQRVREVVNGEHPEHTTPWIEFK